MVGTVGSMAGIAVAQSDRCVHATSLELLLKCLVTGVTEIGAPVTQFWAAHDSNTAHGHWLGASRKKLLLTGPVRIVAAGAFPACGRRMHNLGVCPQLVQIMASATHFSLRLSQQLSLSSKMWRVTGATILGCRRMRNGQGRTLGDLSMTRKTERRPAAADQMWCVGEVRGVTGSALP